MINSDAKLAFQIHPDALPHLKLYLRSEMPRIFYDLILKTVGETAVNPMTSREFAAKLQDSFFTALNENFFYSPAESVVQVFNFTVLTASVRTFYIAVIYLHSIPAVDAFSNAVNNTEFSKIILGILKNDLDEEKKLRQYSYANLVTVICPANFHFFKT